MTADTTDNVFLHFLHYCGIDVRSAVITVEEAFTMGMICANMQYLSARGDLSGENAMKLEAKKLVGQ